MGMGTRGHIGMGTIWGWGLRSYMDRDHMEMETEDHIGMGTPGPYGDGD